MVISAMIKKALAEATTLTINPITGARHSNVTAGFEKTGIYPFYDAAVTKECFRGDAFMAEVNKMRAATLVVPNSPVPGHGGETVGDAAGGAGAVAAESSDDEDSDSEEPAPAPKLTAEELDAAVSAVLKPTAGLVASFKAEAERAPREAAGAKLLTGREHLTMRAEKEARQREAAAKKEADKATRKATRTENAEKNAKARAERDARRAMKAAAKEEAAATRATKTAVKAAKAPVKAAKGPAAPSAAARRTASTAAVAAALTTAAAAAAPLKPPTPPASTAVSGVKRLRHATVVDAPALAALGGTRKRPKTLAATTHD